MSDSLLSVDHFRVIDVTHGYDGRVVLDNFNLVVDRSERLGLIGENGAGKSTLLRILAGVERADAGEVRRPLRTGLLWQEVQFDPRATLSQLVEAALAEVRGIERELESAAVGLEDTAASSDPAERYAAALAAAERAEVWTVDSRREEVLAGLGVAAIPLSRRLDEVSGGQRSRFALAALLLSRPQALLLDEPTNHLDDGAAEFLASQLIHWEGPVVFASHDRSFLDEVATSLIDIDPSPEGPTRFGRSADGGPYTAYLAAKSAERARWEARYAGEQQELKRLKFSVDVTARQIAHDRAPRDNDRYIYSFKGGNIARQTSRRVRNAEGRLEELRANQVRKPPAILSFSGIPAGSHVLDDAVLLQLDGARVDGRLAIERLRVEPRSRILVTGANGAGKSTLLAVLAGIHALDRGSLLRRKGLRIGLLEQDVRWPDASATPRAIYEAAVGEKRADAVPLSSLGLVAPRDLDRAAGTLSVGQQRRLALAMVIAKPPHVFLLDEPTNHLSLSLATELEDALGAYPGAVIAASHDRWLRARWSGEQVQLGR